MSALTRQHRSRRRHRPRRGFRISWARIAPIAVAIIIALIPPPDGLPQHAWYYFAIFVGVIIGLMFEPLPGGAIGLIGVTLVAVLAQFVLFSPDQLAKAGFNAPRAALAWALSGFSNTTVWLIFGAFMFALGYEKTGLGRRIALMLVKAMGRKTLTLGYAIMLADLAARAVHAVEHRAQRRHDLPGDPQPAAALRLEAERPVNAAHRLLPHVGGDRRDLCHELDCS